MIRKVIDTTKAPKAVGAYSQGISANGFVFTAGQIPLNSDTNELVKGEMVGVDFIPAKNREKDKPYILEVNATPGFSGIESINKGTVSKIFNHFKNRDNWTLDN